MRYYSTTAGEMALQLGVSPSDTTITVDTTAGLPVTFPYTLLLDYGTAAEEVVDVTAAATTTLTVVRGRDGTVAQSHDFGAKIRHGMTARDLRESREHEAASDGVHGVTGDVVGTSDAQTLDNKTFEPSDDHSALILKMRADNTAPPLDIKDPAGVRVGSFSDGGFNTYYGSTALLTLLYGGVANLFKTILSVRVGEDRHAIVGNVAAGAVTAKFLRLMSGVTERFSVDSSGNVATTGNVTATGTVTGSNIPATTVGAWTPYTPTLGGITIGNGTVSALYAVVGKTTVVRCKITAGTTTSFSASALTVSLPTAVDATGYDQVPLGSAYLLDSSVGSSSRTVAAAVQSGNAVFFVAPTGTVSNTVPWTWANGDQLNFTATYEAD